jgi:hypothetical protein
MTTELSERTDIVGGDAGRVPGIAGETPCVVSVEGILSRPDASYPSPPHYVQPAVNSEL